MQVKQVSSLQVHSPPQVICSHLVISLPWMMSWRINFVVYMKVLNEPMKFLLSISLNFSCLLWSPTLRESLQTEEMAEIQAY